MKKAIEQFNPAWGAAVMGTGITSIASYHVGGVFRWVAFVLFVINSLFLLYSLVFWLLMWVVTPRRVGKLVDNPATIVFLPTVPAGVLVYISNVMLLRDDFILWLNPKVLAVIWISFSFVIFVMGVHFFYKMFSNPRVEIQHSTYGWLIPPVALILIPVGLPTFSPFFSDSCQICAILFSLISWGSGFFAYLFVNAAITHRYFFHELPLKQMTPTIWIGLGPIGAGTIGLLGLSRVVSRFSALSQYSGFSDAFGIFFWGFGALWYSVALVITLHKTFFEEIPYSMGWWAFTFPVGAYATSTFLIYKLLECKIIHWLFYLFYATLLFFWTLTFYRTFKYHLWRPKLEIRK